MNKASIVIVDASTAVTGGLRCASRTARLLAPWAETTLVLPRDSHIAAEELGAFAQVVRLPLLQLRKSPRAIMLYVPALLVAGWQLRRLLARQASTALILNDFFMMQGAVVRLLGYRGRIATWVRFDPTRFPKLLSRAWLSAAYRTSDAVVAVSDFIVALLPPSPKLRRIYDTIDLDLPGPSADAQQPATTRRDLVCVANYIVGKGQDDAIAAFAPLADEFPDARLVFYGGDMGLEKNRDYLAALRTQAGESGFGDRILFRPFATDVAAAFSRAAAALVLSQSESFGLTCLEASQLGVPVIAFRSGGPAEIVVDKQTGYLCDLGDIAAVTRAMRLVLADPRHAQEMGCAAAVHVQGKFGREAFVAAARDVLRLG